MKATGVHETAPKIETNLSAFSPRPIQTPTVVPTMHNLEKFLLICLFLVFAQPLKMYDSNILFAGYIIRG
jgi:hypothetical protein